MNDRTDFENLDSGLDSAHWCCNGNAEDCALCTDPNPPYPFLCPGHPRTAANERLVGEATEATEPATECADALAAELHRRWVRLEELRQGMDRSEAAERRRMQLHGEVMGLRGALGIVLGGTVPGGDADRLGMEYHRAWMKRTGR
jgi:hypothetical protein